MPSFKAFADFQKRIQQTPQDGNASNVQQPQATTSRESDIRSSLQQAEAPELEPLRVGVRVRVVGLKARPELNDIVGTLVTEDKARSRWQVLLENGGGSKLFKSVNLEPATPPEADAPPAPGGEATTRAPQPPVRQSGPTPVDTPSARRVDYGEHRDPVAPVALVVETTDGGRPAVEASADLPKSRSDSQADRTLLHPRHESSHDATATAAPMVAPVMATPTVVPAAAPATMASAAKVAPRDAESQGPETFDAFVAGIDQCLKDSDVMWDVW